MGTRAKLGRIGQAAVLLSASFLAGRSSGAEAEPVRIEYVAPMGCPDGTAFVAMVRDRTTRFRQAEPGEQVRRLSTRITKGASAFLGRLRIANPDGSSSLRSLDGPFCDELASALALMTALLIDPDAGNNQAKVGADPPTEKDTVSVDPVLERHRPDPETTSPSIPVAPTQATRPWQWSAGMQGRATSGMTPSLVLGGELFVEAEPVPAAKLSPVLRAGVGVEQADETFASPAGASANFLWFVAALQGCPVQISTSARRASVYPCVSLRLGWLRSEGRGISQPNRTVSFWSDLGSVLRGRVSLSGGLSLEAEIGLIVTLTHPSFQILDVASGSVTAAYSVSRFGGSAGIGASYRFP
jgi:hypothetical protein